MKLIECCPRISPVQQKGMPTPLTTTPMLQQRKAIRHIPHSQSAKTECVGALKPPHPLAYIPKTSSARRSNLRWIVNIFCVFIAKCKLFGIYIFGITGIQPQNSRQTATLMRCEFIDSPLQRISITGNRWHQQVNAFWTLYKQTRTPRNFIHTHNPIGRETKRTEKGRKITPGPLIRSQKHIAQILAVCGINGMPDHLVAAF